MSLNTFLKGQLRVMAEKYDVVAVSSPGAELEEMGKREGVRTVAVPMERHISLIKDFTALCRLIVLFAKEQPYIVHSMTPKAGLLAMVAAWITRVPVRIHTFTGLVFPTSTGFMQKLLMAMDGITCACATFINPEGQGVARDLKRFHITGKPLHIIAHGNVRGVDMRHYDRTKEVTAEAERLRRKDCLTFCFVGRIVGDKGINELIAAFRKLYDKHDDVRLMLVGEYESRLDPVKEETRQTIDTHPNITSMGLQADVRPYLAASDVFVFPSYREGFPNVVLEAGAMGLPSIVTDINGSNEIIREGINGRIIPSKNEAALLDMMEWFYDHRDTEVKSMAGNARKIVAENYEQQMILHALMDTYAKL